MNKQTLRQIGLFAMLILGFHAIAYATVKNHALLVGVSHYPNFSADLQLDGPKHDVELAYTVLSQKGFKTGDIVALSENKGHKEPTYAAIISELKALETRVNPDDFVFLMMAGHGSRQPAAATSNDEPDGYDEIFLPADADKWNSYIGSVENAITDNEIGERIDAIRAKGANVWAIFDSCHSGTMTRGLADEEVRYRRVSEAALGIPKEVNRPDVVGLDSGSWLGSDTVALMSGNGIRSRGFADTPKRGTLTVFSAAQTYETTPEMKLPRKAAQSRYHGLFTYSLMEAIVQSSDISYRQLAQQVVARYGQLPWRNTTPLFSGEALETKIFGGSKAAAGGFAADRLKGNEVAIQAGSLHGFATQSIVSLFSAPTVAAADYLGDAEVIRASAVASVAKTLFAQKSLPKQSYAVLKTSAEQFVLTVAASRVVGQSDEDYQSLKALTKKAVEGSAALAISDELPGLRLAVFEQKLWLLTPDQSIPCEYQVLPKDALADCEKNRSAQRLLNLPIAPEGLSAEYVQNALQRIARGDALLKLQQQLSAGGAQAALTVSVEWAEPGGDFAELPDLKVPTLNVGDDLKVTVRNTSRVEQDVSILYKDGQYGITQLYPNRGEPNRLAPDTELNFEFTVSGDTQGLENFIVLNSESRGVPNDFAFLEQSPFGVSLRGSRCENKWATKGLPNQFTVLLASSCDSTGEASRYLTRGLQNKPKVDFGEMQVLNWQVMP